MVATGESYVALRLESGIAGGMLGELVGPKDPVGVVLADPVLVHVCQQVQLAIRLEPLVNRLALVRRDWGSMRRPISGVWRRLGIILSATHGSARVLGQSRWSCVAHLKSQYCVYDPEWLCQILLLMV